MGVFGVGGMQGMELCAGAVLVLLFIAVLKQFGILEPISAEGKTPQLTFVNSLH